MATCFLEIAKDLAKSTLHGKTGFMQLRMAMIDTEKAVIEGKRPICRQTAAGSDFSLKCMTQ